MVTLMLVQAAAGVALLRRSAIELSPPEALPLGGYTARGAKAAEPGGDPLFARTTVVQQGKVRIAVVSVEMLTIPESLHREVAAQLPADLRLFLIATHTHCAPDSQMLNDRMTFSIPGIASYKSRWLKWYAGWISQGVSKALASPGEPVSTWGVRRARLPLNRGRRVGALPDEASTMVEAFAGSTYEAVWFHYAAHAVFWGPERMTTSGDWPGAVEANLGADVLVGAIGDVSPAAQGATPADRIAAFAKTATDAHGRALAQTLPGDSRLMWVQTGIELGKQVPHPEFARANRIPEPLAQSLVDKFAPKDARISAFRIGKLAFVGVPGEPTSHLGRRIRDFGRAVGFEDVLVCSHVNGWMGYILDARDYARGGYEATLSMYGPGQGDRVVEAGCEALRRLAKGG